MEEQDGGAESPGGERALGPAPHDETWLQRTIDGLPYQVYLKDAQCRFVMVNSATAEALGMAPGDIIGRTVLELLPDQDATPHWQAEQDVLRTGLPLEEFIYPYTDPRGQQHWYSETEARAPLPDGTVGLIGVVREVTPRQRAAERLRVQKELAVGLLSAETIGEALSAALRAAIEGTGADGGAAYVADPASESLSLSEAVNLSPPPRLPLGGFPLLGEGPLQAVYMATRDLEAAPDVRDVLASEGVRCFGAAPLGQPDRPLASLHVASRALDEFPPEAREHLEAVLALAGQAVARLEAQQSLRASEARYRTLLQSASDAVFVHLMAGEIPGRFIDANDRACQLLGYTREELLSMTIREVDVPEQARRLPGIIAALSTAGHAVFETEHVTKDGRRVPTEVSACLLDLQGQRVVLAAVRDISERRQTEEALRASERRLADTIDFLPDATVVIDADGKVVAWNRAMEEMTGVPAETMLGKGDYEHALPFYGQRRPILVDLALQGADLDTERYHMIERLGNTVVGETTIAMPGGRDAILWGKAIPLRDGAGHIVGAIETIRDVTDRRRAEDAARASERRFAEFIEFLPEATLAVSAAGEVTAWNRAMEELTGVRAEEMLGKGNHEHALPFYGERRPTLVDVALHGQEPDPERYRMVRREGDTIVAEATTLRADRGLGVLWGKATALRDELGNVTGAIETIRDVTERRRAEEALRESERRLADTISFLPDATLVINAAGEVVAWNRALEEMTGVPAGEMVGKGNYEHALPFYGDRRPLLADLVLDPSICTDDRYPQMRREGDALVAEITAARPRGRDTVIWAKATALRDQEGNVVGAIEAIRDITDRRRAEEALRASEEQYRRIVETANEGILATDCDGVIRFANPRMAEIVGATLDEVVGRNAADFMDADEAADHARRMAERATGVPGQYERRLRHSDGHEVWAALSASPIVGDDGQFAGSFAMLADITGRKQAERERERLEAQLAEARKLESIGQLAGGVAHDLNNMLAPILGYAELLAGDPAFDRRQQTALQEITKAAQRARDLVRQLLAFARRQTLEVRPLDLNQVVADLEPMLRRTIRENVDIELHLEPSLPPIQGDAGQIEQIILNLAVNAQDAMIDGGVLAIETSAATLREPDLTEADATPGRYVVMAIRDNGVGMDEATLSRAFEPFFTTKQTGRGTGLGLSTVYGIVKQHGGHITVASEVGKGTAIRVCFPQSPEAPEPDSLPASPGSAAGTETVIVVEDQAEVRNLVQTMLEQNGYTVLSATDGAEAVELCELWPGPIHLLVTDVIMRGMNGRQVYEALRANRPELAVLYMSGYPSNVITHHGVLDPGVHFIAKPFSLRDFTAKVREVLDASGG